MGVPRRLVIIVSSVFVLLILAISLGTSLQARAPPRRLLQISLAQAATLENAETDGESKVGSKINGTDFDRADILVGTSTVVPHSLATTITVDIKPVTATADGQGMIGQTPISSPSLPVLASPPRSTSVDEGFIGDKPAATPSSIPAPPAPAIPKTPVLALTYDGSGGPKHCRGNIVGKLTIEDASTWKDGACVDLPSMARCGIFYAGKDSGCEAQLFNMAGCVNQTKTYVNTVVFMPEERPVGALWNSMFVKCGIVAPEAKILDPALLGGILKPGKKAGG